ncbi:hypothetical protein BGLA2_420106 [Burkholderia gladioli]|nr:hypothetical protein BGLA2_420106 [Burkholderia gladioli]
MCILRACRKLTDVMLPSRSLEKRDFTIKCAVYFTNLLMK